MKGKQTTKILFAALGKVDWNRSLDAFVVQTSRGATILLSPNSDDGCNFGVHIDEMSVPEPLQKNGIATEAMIALCELADLHQFRLQAGPIGFSESPWREKFVEWTRRFGFEPDRSLSRPRLDDPTAFYVHRFPRAICSSI
ncbi:MAG: hypothetical protein ABSA47_10400 [Verrucomicrobiota bacterium]|jgi:hypothetical protein